MKKENKLHAWPISKIKINRERERIEFPCCEKGATLNIIIKGKYKQNYNMTWALY